MHLSRVLSPVIDVLTPSLFAVRAPLFEAPAVEEGTDAVDALRGAGAGLKATWIYSASCTRNEEIHAPEDFAAPFEWVPAACFSLSTAVFHARTISLASSETSFAACERNFPTARPALLSCGEERNRMWDMSEWHEKESRDPLDGTHS